MVNTWNVACVCAERVVALENFVATLLLRIEALEQENDTCSDDHGPNC